MNNRQKEILQDLIDTKNRQIQNLLELQQENTKLKEEYNKVVHESTEFESKVYDLQQRIDKTITHIDILQEIIYQQPTCNKEDDMWLQEKLAGIKNILKGEKVSKK